VLGLLGDPRLRVPADADYWVKVETDDGPVSFGRFPVTNHEFQKFVDAGGYDDATLWSDEGRAWLETTSDPWPERAKAPDAVPFIIANQPVVGVTWYEAEAYATWAKARLPRFDERLRAVRGADKRPYPWGSPFGEGNANTREEVLNRPCGVGLYPGDRTPEGVYDLAGNVAEWTADGPGDERWYAPGAWDQPSMAAWAKAREHERPDARWTGIGFRIVRD
jgi:formylglycine-generating enzyme required for sulfatase activity